MLKSIFHSSLQTGATMGFFSKSGTCSNCGTDGAIKSLFKTKCPNPSCTYYDSSLLVSAAGANYTAHKNHLAESVRLEYLNYQGVARVFDINPKTLLKKGRHVSVCLAGQTRRVSLAVKRIQNPSVLP